MITDLHKTFSFEAAHRLPHVEPGHKCSRLHGHSFEVVITVRGPVDPVKGWVVDFADLEKAWAPLHAQLDHNYLNEVAGLENPTSEHVGAWILERLVVPGVQVRSVYVAETCRSACTVWASPGDEPRTP